MRRQPGVGQLCDRRPQAALLGSRGRAQIVAPSPDAVNALGEIDDFEIRGERADQRFGIAGRQPRHQRVQLVIRPRPCPRPRPRPRNRGVPRALYELEERVATLLAQHVPDQCAEGADIVSQLRIFRRKLDFAPAFPVQEPSGGVESRTAATPQAARSTDARPSLPTAIVSTGPSGATRSG